MSARVCLVGEDRVGEYARALRACGLDPDLLPPSTASPAGLAAYAGLVLTGGVDVDPARYGAEPHPSTDVPDTERDQAEIAVALHAFASGLPIFAICRGVQLLNVAFGGTLVQHIPDAYGERIPHRLADAEGSALRGVLPEHVVSVAPGSRLAAILGATRLTTGARHHQAIGTIASGLRAVAWTDDGVIEALEAPRARGFVLAVQWHPESTLDDDQGESRKLFAAFAQACSAR